MKVGVLADTHDRLPAISALVKAMAEQGAGMILHANWHLIAREWLFGDPPSTELGALEEPFHIRTAA